MESAMPDTEFQDLLLDRVGTDGRVLRITLNRPDVLNALSPSLINELDIALRQAESDRTVRVIILRGAGRAFSAGWDLGGTDLFASQRYAGDSYTIEDDDGRPLTYNFGLGLRQGAEVQLKLWDVAKVTIVQAHGYALAGGMELAMMADLITASDTCQFGHPGHRGIGVARNGMILPLVLGMRKAKELFFTGDPISGTEAEEIGLINYAWPEDELDERTIAFADRIANLSGDFLGVLKQGVNSFYENMGMRQAIQQITQLDATAQHTESGYAWQERIRTLGLRGALQARDTPYGDYGAAKR
jgi:enoyl-CoA hydratase